ncbi:DUF4150 domain-containing protein [Salmonella enterica]|nr:DUF4150 domain-containing protein [Salmonella enterica]
MMANNYMARQDGLWTVISLTPDVCKTPMGSATPPVPYSVIANMGDAVQTVQSVRANGSPVLVLDQSFIPCTKGDEPGVAKGIKSGTVGDICEPLEFSKTVYVGGKPVLRHFDKFWMNARNTTGVIIGQYPAASNPASDADPAPEPETKEEQSIWDMMLMIQMDQNRAQIEAAPIQLDLTIGAAKAFWNQFPDMVTMLGQGAIMQHAGEMQMNGAMLSAMGMDDTGTDMYNMGGDLREHAGDFNLDEYRLEMSNRTQEIGGMMYDYGSLALGGYGLAKGGFMGLKAMRAASKLAREEAAAGKFTADMLKMNKVDDVATDTEKLADNVVPEGQDGANIKGETEGTGDQSKCVGAQLCTKPGEPVDIGTGDFLQHFSVLSLPGSLPLTLSRFYRSQAKGAGIFGPKWTDEWACSLEVHGNRLHFTDSEGVVLYYRLPQDGVFRNAVNSRQAYYRLTGSLRDGVNVFDRRSQQTQIFSPAGNGILLLSARHDRYGNRIDFVRTDSLLTEIRHSDGYTLALDWRGQQLMGIDLVTPQRQRLVTCRYDSNGFLAECDTFQFSHLWHEYTPEGFMTRWRDTDKTCVDIHYDSQGRAISTLSTEGYFDDRFIYNDDEKCTTYLDAEGGETRYWYNEDGLVTRSLDPLGREEITVWNNARLQSRTDALGRTTAYRYNREGEIIQVALPGGYGLFYEYNDTGQLTCLTTTDNQAWQWIYDKQGSVVSLIDPQGRKQQFSYSEQGDLLARILPGGATWRWSHDALHQVLETVAPDGGITQTEQDMLGRLLSVKDPLGFTTQFRHSKAHAGPQGSVEEINRPDGVRELMQQNSEKLPESFTDGEGKTTRYEYGAFDLLMALVRPDGERLTCRYDKLTRLTEITNAEGEHYRLEYDKAGQLIAETDFTGRTLTYTYDAAGRCIRTTFPDGTHLNRRYNVTDQVTDEEVTKGDSDRTLSATTFRYDTQRRLVEAKNNDATVTFEYNDANQIVAETINGRRTEYRYDPDLDTVSQRTTAGITEHFTRNLMGSLASWQIADHTPLIFEHDLRGQETSRRSEAGFYQRLGYTPTGMPTQQKAGDHRAGPYERNKSLERKWLYDKAYNLTMVSDSLRGSMFNSVTKNDQIDWSTWTGSGNVPMCEERFSYDKNLNITRRQTWVNEVLESEAHQQQQHGRVVSREHKGWRHQTSRINPDTGKPEEGKFVKVVNAHDITWKYDVNGRLVEKLVDKGGYRPLQWRYRWDARSQLTGLETPDGERWEYKYDPFGRRISKRCTNRDKPGTDFHWNGDQLTEEIPVGADGKQEDENAVRWIYEPGSFTPLARYEKGQLHYAVKDTTGRVQELLTEDGTIVWRGKQQLWGREEYVNKEDAPVCRLRFPGQYEDTESGLYYNRFRYYDCETGQYLCADPIGLAGGINLYQYAPNPLKYIDPLGLCKVEGARARQAQMLQDDVGYNISPKSWDQYPAIGRDGTFVTDKEGALKYFSGIENGEVTISKSLASTIEKDMGLYPGSLSDGFNIRKVDGISNMQPRSPLSGNDYFLGPGQHLPGGAPEMVINSIPTSTPVTIRVNVN